MIRKSTCILKYSNSSKLTMLERVYEDFLNTVREYIGMIISGKLPFKQHVSSKVLPTINFSHSQWKQIAYVQASEIVRSNLTYIKNKTFKQYQKLIASSLNV